MRLPLHIVITTHSQFGREQNVLLFYSLFIIEFTYCMYIIVNKATFIVAETIMVIIKNSIKLINTTSLSDSKTRLIFVSIVMGAKKVVNNYFDGTKIIHKQKTP